MGLALKIKKTQTRTLYRFWNTVADGWSTNWLTRKGALAYLRKRKEDELENYMAHEEETFPKSWPRK